MADDGGHAACAADINPFEELAMAAVSLCVLATLECLSRESIQPDECGKK